MFESQLQEHQYRISSAASRPQERKMALQTGIEFANDAVKQLDADEAHATSEFHRRKAAWKRDVAKDEQPREILEQIFAARIFRIAGLCAIGIEIGIATWTLYQLLAYGFSLVVALILALVIATIITLPITYVFHGAIYYLVTRLNDPFARLKRLTIYFVALPLFFVILSIAAYVAVFRLDTETLYALQAVISTSKFVAMFGFMILGTALLVAADLYGWSRFRAAKYKAIKDERQEIASKRREWQGELDGLEEEQRANNTQQQTQASSPQEDQPNQQVASSNGNSSSVSEAQVASKSLAVLLVLASLYGLSACAPPPPQIKKIPVQESVICDLVIDASGITNRQALQQAGVNVLNSMAKTVEQQHVSKLSVFWFGHNGWTAEQKLPLVLPPSYRLEVVKRAGEIEGIRRDLGEFDKQRNEKALKEAEAQAQTEYRGEMVKSLAPLTIETLVPASTVESSCTDINGMLSRFARPASASRHIVLIVTDGRQNCGGKYEIEQVSLEKNTAFVVVLVPATDADGREDFELRSKRFTEACPQCVVVPFYREDLDQAVAEALKKRDEHSSITQK